MGKELTFTVAVILYISAAVVFRYYHFERDPKLSATISVHRRNSTYWNKLYLNDKLKVTVPPTVNNGAKVTFPSTVKNGLKVTVPPTVKKGVKVTFPSTVKNGLKVTVPPTVKNGVKVTSPSTVKNGLKVTVPPIVKDGLKVYVLPNYEWSSNPRNTTNGKAWSTGYMWVNPVGRLGNTICQTMASIAIATKNRKLLISYTNNGKFAIFSKIFAYNFTQYTKIPNNVTFSKSYHLPVSKYDPKVFNLSEGNYQMTGYMESFRYIEGFEDEVRQRLHFSPVYKNISQTYLNYISSSMNKSHVLNSTARFVGIHVRRGDRTWETSKQAYYKAAIAHTLRTSKNSENVHFVISSEKSAKKWVKKNINDATMGTPNQSVSYHYISNIDPHVDFAILSHCNSTIMSVGTFGQWVGFLAGGEVVYDKSWQWVTKDRYPSSWVGL